MLSKASQLMKITLVKTKQKRYKTYRERVSNYITIYDRNFNEVIADYQINFDSDRWAVEQAEKTLCL